MAGVRIVLWLYLLPLVFGDLEDPCTTKDSAAISAFHPSSEHNSEDQSTSCGSEDSNTKDQVCPRASTRSDFIEKFPEPPVCGSSNITWKDNKIYGGEDAKLGNFPWMALLGYNDSKVPWRCGGSLISIRHVLTAGHCVHSKESTLYVVRLGELNYEDENDGTNPLDASIKTTIVHKDYELAVAPRNDIGLIILEKDVEFTDFIKPICIRTSVELNYKDFDRNIPIVAGWGATESGTSSPHLQAVQVPIVSNDDCAEMYSALNTVIDETVICAGYEEGGKDACQGDSGGPLMEANLYAEAEATYVYQIGIVSYGFGCAKPRYPGVYARVSYFLPWLEEQVLGKSEPEPDCVVSQ